MPDENPTLPFEPITVNGRDLKMCFDFEAIAAAEAEMRKTDRTVYLLFAPWDLTLANVQTLFAASLRVYQPEISIADAKKLVTWKTVLPITTAIQAAYETFMPEEVEAQPDPPPAPDAEG